MQIETRLSTAQNYQCLELNLSMRTWQNWMTDDVSLMPYFTESAPEIIFLSFRSGNIISRCIAETERMKDLFSRDCLALAAIGLENKYIMETLIFKNESFDTTGDFFKGISLQMAGDFNTAIDFYNSAIEKNENLYRAHNLLGLCQRLSGDNEKAERHYLKSISLKPDLPEAYSNLGILYLKTGREAEAEKLFYKALEADEFYFNALLRLSQILMKNKNVLDSDYSDINLKLIQLHHSLPAARQRLAEAASFAGMQTEEYIKKLQSKNTCFNSAENIQLMHSIEKCISNGAIFAAISGIRNLIQINIATHHETPITGWCRLKLGQIQKISRVLKFLEIYNAISRLLAEFPQLKFTEKNTGNSPLTKNEFFSLALLEIMRDGQIDPPEKALVAKLKQLLEISDERYYEIINKIRAHIHANPFIEKEPKGFQPQRLFKSLVRAALRDKILEESEKKILVFASKAFGITSEDVIRIINEVKK